MISLIYVVLALTVLRQDLYTVGVPHYNWRQLIERSVNDTAMEECNSTEFSCDNGRCVSPSLICNDQDDCGDNTDELYCNNMGPTEDPPACRADQHTCSSGHCISVRDVCDGGRDCWDGSDELGCHQCRHNSLIYCHNGGTCKLTEQSFFCVCPSRYVGLLCETEYKCSASEYTCNNSRCVPARYVCDGDNDCRDGSDEVNCQQCRHNPSIECLNRGTCVSSGQDSFYCRCKPGFTGQLCESLLPCESGEYTCKGGRCIPVSFQCNGNKECQDGDDEEECKECPAGFAYSRGADRCLKLITQINNWQSAQDNCAALTPGGHLAVIQSPAENAAMVSFIRKGHNALYCNGIIFIGGQRIKPDNCSTSFVWKLSSDSEYYIPLTYTNWDIDEPNCRILSSTPEGCLHIQHWRESHHHDRVFKWNDVPCRFEGCSLCQTPICNYKTEFTCGNGDCIPLELRCDHTTDCPQTSDGHTDNSDELNCVYPAATPKCGEDQFTCSSGQCIARSLRCNGVNDCDGELPGDTSSSDDTSPGDTSSPDDTPASEEQDEDEDGDESKNIVRPWDDDRHENEVGESEKSGRMKREKSEDVLTSDEQNCDILRSVSKLKRNWLRKRHW